MEKGFDISPQKLFGIQGSPDTSNQMFGMMDEVAGNFAEEFEAAKARKSDGAKKPLPKKKEKEEVSAKETESDEQAATEETASEATPIPGEEEDALLEGESDLEVELEQSTESTLSDGEEATEEELVASDEEGVAVNDTKEEETATPQENEEELIASRDEERNDTPNKAEAPAQKPPLPEATLPTQKELTPTQITETGKSEEALPEAPKKSEAPQPKGVELGNQATAQVEETKRPKIQSRPELAAAPEEKQEEAPVPENFHSIEPEGESEIEPELKVIQLDSKEAKRILDGLNQIAARSQIQNPVASKVSPRLLEGLKANNAQLAGQIEAAKAPTATGSGSAGNGGSAFAGGGNEGRPTIQSSRSDRAFENPRMEQLKQKVMEQVKFQMKMAMRNNSGDIQLKLRPGVLGSVKVSLIVEKAQVTASFVVENNSVRDLLQRSSSQLSDMLAEHGLEADAIEVSVDDQSSDSSESGKAFASVEDQKAAREYLASFATIGSQQGATDTTEESSEEESADPDQILNIVA